MSTTLATDAGLTDVSDNTAPTDFLFSLLGERPPDLACRGESGAPTERLRAALLRGDESGDGGLSATAAVKPSASDCDRSQTACSFLSCCNARPTSCRSPSFRSVPVDEFDDERLPKSAARNRVSVSFGRPVCAARILVNESVSVLAGRLSDSTGRRFNGSSLGLDTPGFLCLFFGDNAVLLIVV
jgi:hypothetical protein